MQHKEMLRAVSLLALIAVASGIQDNTLQTHFLPQADHVLGKTSKVTDPKPPTTPDGKTEDAQPQKKNGSDHSPSERKMEYFRPVSVTLQCVMALTIVAMLVYTFLSLSRNYDELSATFTPSVATQMLTVGSRVSSFAPMLCMLFVACRMYVLATTEGLGEPPKWVKCCMWTAVGGVALQLINVLSGFSEEARIFRVCIIPLFLQQLELDPFILNHAAFWLSRCWRRCCGAKVKLP